jgi:hypothetical protein
MRKKQLEIVLSIAVAFIAQAVSPMPSHSQDMGWGSILQVDKKKSMIANMESGMLLIKLSTKGTVLWQINPPNEFLFCYHLIDKNGDLIVMFSGQYKTLHQNESYIAKYRGSDGSQVWETQMENLSLCGGYAFLDSKGDVIFYSPQQVITKYSGVNGSILFQNTQFSQ